MIRGDRTAPPSLTLLLRAALLCCSGCSPGHLDTFPPLVRPGVEVTQSDYRLQEAVEEYVNFRNLPVSPQRMRSGVITTEWFEVNGLEIPPTPLAECPRTTSQAARGEPSYRARYRFSILPRASIRLFRVEAHWQKEVPAANPDEAAWVDCSSTGAWEREASERIILRARLLSRRFRNQE